MRRFFSDTLVKLNNDANNKKVLHYEVFSPDVLGSSNEKDYILLGTIGTPYHYVMIRKQYPNLNIYGIEDFRLESTFRYCINELDCKIVFIKDTSSIKEWDRCIKELKKIYTKNECKDMKFNKAAVNPPFGVDKKGSNKMLHWNIFEKIIEVCPKGKIAYICPIKWDRNPNKDFDWVRYKMYKHLSSYRYVDSSVFKNTQIDGGEVAIHIVDMTLENNECGLGDILEYVEENKCILKNNSRSSSNVENKISEIMKSDNPHSFYENRCVRIDRSEIIKKSGSDKLREKIENIVYKNGCTLCAFASRVPDKKGAIVTKKGYNKGVLLRDDAISDICSGKGSGYFLIGGNNEQHLNMLMKLLETSKLLHKCVQMKTVSRRSTKDALSLIPDINYTEIISKVEGYSRTNRSIDINKLYNVSNTPTDYALLWYMIYKNNLENTYTNNDVEDIIQYVNNNL